MLIRPLFLLAALSGRAVFVTVVCANGPLHAKAIQVAVLAAAVFWLSILTVGGRGDIGAGAASLVRLLWLAVSTGMALLVAVVVRAKD
jgi:hypothetical protein